MLLFIIFRNFLYLSQSRGSFNLIASLLAASRSRMPFFNSQLIQGALFVLARPLYYKDAVLNGDLQPIGPLVVLP